jgi:hypothetical protein
VFFLWTEHHDVGVFFRSNTVSGRPIEQIAEPTLSRWKKAGCPKQSRGLYDLKAVFKWFLENIVNGTGEGAGCEDEDLRESRALYWQNKARLMEVQALKAQDAVFNRSEIYNQWAARLFVLCSSLENLADRLPPILHGKTPNEMFAFPNSIPLCSRK